MAESDSLEIDLGSRIIEGRDYLRRTADPQGSPLWAKILNLTRGRTISDRALVAVTRRQRMRGLLDYERAEEACALVLFNCRNVHTFGMKFPLDLIFWGKEGEVLRNVSALPPGRFSPLVWRARGMAELPAGVLSASGTRPGDRIAVVRTGETEERI